MLLFVWSFKGKRVRSGLLVELEVAEFPAIFPAVHADVEQAVPQRAYPGASQREVAAEQITELPDPSTTVRDILQGRLERLLGHVQ